MSELNAEDRQILLAADELYYLDWRENDDDENTAGWRHPGYFMEVNQPYDFSKLVEAGFMEKRETQGYVSYRITKLGAGMAKSLLATEAQPANDNRDTGWSQRDMDELGFSAMGLQPAPADAPAVDGDVSMPLDGEAFDEWVDRVGRSVEDTAFYWKQIAADNLELAADNGAEVESLREQLAAAQAAKATAAAIANDYRDQIWVHQGTLRVLKSWLGKEDGFSAEDGFTEASILGMVERDLEASEKMDTRTLTATATE